MTLLDRPQPDLANDPRRDQGESGAPSAASVSEPAAEGAAKVAAGRHWPLGWLRSAGQYLFELTFSSLTRRIVSLNLAGLIALAFWFVAMIYNRLERPAAR